MIKRCDNTLEEYESKLHLMERFRNIKEKLEQIKLLSSEEAVKKLADDILEEL